METIQAIHTRRSIRRFRSESVSETIIEDILSAAMMAPSAGNQQPWQFVVITDRTRLDSIVDIHPHASMITQAPLAILVCGDLSLEKYAGFWVQDCSAAMQNLLLAAHDKGLGAVWTGIYPVNDRVVSFKSFFDLPDQVVPLGLAVIGYPDQQLGSKSRFRPDRVHHDAWKK